MPHTIIQKMPVRNESPIQYFWPSSPNIELTALLGKTISIEFNGDIYCTSCNKKIQKTFGEGFCYPCFLNAPEAAECIIRPELCEAHLGKGRDPEWEMRNHNQPHVVYLALSSHIKVGITRKTQLPTRWIDQGASQAACIFETPYRQLAGKIEVFFKSHFSDRTAWQKMLKNETSDSDLEKSIQTIEALCPSEFQEYRLPSPQIETLSYPMLDTPKKVKSINLDTIRKLSGELTGIKGQYLIFDNESVINIRKYTGYSLALKILN